MKNITLSIFILFFARNISAQSYTLEQQLFWLSKIWKDVSNNFHSPQHLKTIKWDSLFIKNTLLIVNSSPMNDNEFYSLLKKNMAALSDGHTEFYYTPINKLDYLPIEIDFIDNRFFISAVHQESSFNISLGDEITSINNIKIRKYLEKYAFPYISASTIQNRIRQSLPYICRGHMGDSLLLELKKTNGSIQKVFLEYCAVKKNIGRNNMICTYNSSINYSRRNKTEAILKRDSYNRDFYYLRYDSFVRTSTTNLMKSVANEINKSDYIILDLRHCGGGNELEADTLLMCFLNIDKLKTYPSLTRKNNAFHAAQGIADIQYRDYYNNAKLDTLNPDIIYKRNLPLFTQPLFILVSDRTFSAAEDFLITLKLHYPRRAIIIGTPTGGSTGAPLVYRLPSHNAYYRICSRKPLLPDSLFDAGIQPDYLFESDINAILNNKDSIFEYTEKIYNRYKTTK